EQAPIRAACHGSGRFREAPDRAPCAPGFSRRNSRPRRWQRRRESVELPPMPSRYLSRLRLTQFRNYASAALDLDSRHLVLVGPTGAGKTIRLEAISMLAPDRGMRRAPFEELAAHGSDGAWAV